MPPPPPPRPIGPALARVLLAPASIAVVGASDDAGKTSGRPLAYLRSGGYAGRLYAVNAQRATVQGAPAYRDLPALPEVPEQVFVVAPTEGVLPAVRQCVALGVPLVSVLAGGFAEAGAEGAAREAALRDALRGSGTRLLGPNSIGVVDLRRGLLATANAAFAEAGMPVGRVFVASHSGSMLGALVSRARDRGIGFAALVSVGGEADLSLGEICAATLDDEGIDSYLLFLESLRHGAELEAFARGAAARGKPVVAYKLGRSAAAAELSATHTGALAGDDDVAEAFLRGLGIARVGTLEAQLEALPLARRLPLPAGEPRPRRVGVVTTTGGGAAMVVDQLGLRGVDVALPSPATLQRLAQAGLPATPARLLDLTLAGTRYPVMKQAIDTYLGAPDFDLVIVVVGSSARLRPELAVAPIVDSAGAAKPLAAVVVPEAPQALAMLAAAGVPAFRNPEPCADAVAAVFARRMPGPVTRRTDAVARAEWLDEAEAYTLFDAVGMPHVAGVTIPLDADVAKLPPLPFGYPVTAKLCSAAVRHKTEIGGVVLEIADASALQCALAVLRDNAARLAPQAGCIRALVQPMCRGIGEVLIGYRVDADAGPLVMVAAGGVAAEVLRDRALRLAPVDEAGANAMLAELRTLPLLQGHRGRPAGDIGALARAIAAMSRLALRPELRVVEAEANPVIVRAAGEGVVAVDALVRRAR